MLSFTAETFILGKKVLGPRAGEPWTLTYPLKVLQWYYFLAGV